MRGEAVHGALATASVSGPAVGRRKAAWDVRCVPTTGSTHADLVRQVREGTAGPGTVLVAEEQTAGRGRAGRQWSCPRGAGLMFSTVIEVTLIPLESRGWLGAVLGLAIRRAIVGLTATTVELKWPNDVLIAGSKCGGILAEMTSQTVIVSAGLNVSLTAAELPMTRSRVAATSLLLSGAWPVDRNVLLARILDEFATLLDRWQQAGGDVDAGGVRPDYRLACSTLGSAVRIELPGGGAVVGTAVDVAADGGIVIDSRSHRRTYAAGDVMHLRAQAV